MAPRRNAAAQENAAVDPIDAAIADDREGLASELSSVLEGLEGIASDQIYGIVYKIPAGNGKFQFVKNVYPPFDTSEIMSVLQDEYGGGDYQLRVMVEKRIRKNINFSIIQPKTSNPLIAPKDNTSDMMQMMMQMSASSKSDMMQMMTMLMTSMQSAQQSQANLMGILIPAMMGGKEKTSELMTAFAALSGGGEKSGGLKEAMEMLVTAKTLFASDGNSGGGFDPDASLISNGLKLAGPLLSGLTTMVKERGQNQQPMMLPQQPQTVVTVPPQAVMLPGMEPNPVTDDEPSRFPVLDLIKEDVLFFFRRGYEPDLAAENVVEILDRNEVKEEALHELIAAFTVSAAWIEDLASCGIDLRSNPEWANLFLSSLVSIYTDPSRRDDDTGRGSGGSQDASTDGGPIAAGQSEYVSSQPSGETD